jgi:uncharacterized membrane protein required for colicin V production
VPSWLNPFDVLIALALLMGIALGFIRGLVSMAMSLLILYVAAVMAMTLHAPIAKWMSYAAGDILPRTTAQLITFALLLILTTVLLNFLVKRMYKNTELPGVRQIDQLGGMFIGFILTCTWIGLALVALDFVLSATRTDAGSTGTAISYYFRTSNLIPIFYNILPIIIATLRPWMPKGLPPGIFEFSLP